MSKDETTLNSLAQMVQRGFEQTATKQDVAELRAGLGRVETRLEHVETRLDHHDASLAYITERVDKIDTRLDRIENLLGEDFLGRMQRLEQKVQRLTAKVGLD